ncbi:MAG: type II secretion system F family protein [Eggerthellaceae bacterium]
MPYSAPSQVAGGAAAMPRAVKQAQRERADGEAIFGMLEVVALGLRSGLSFDRSFGLYGAHFDSEFAGACAQALRAWSSGLATREESLRDLASSYDSALFARVVEGAVRALRFGSSLAEGFESAAVEARAVHRAHVEERVAKAPVKMMVPTGALILPAMLLLVLGPVLLELMEGM